MRKTAHAQPKRVSDSKFELVDIRLCRKFAASKLGQRWHKNVSGSSVIFGKGCLRDVVSFYNPNNTNSAQQHVYYNTNRNKPMSRLDRLTRETFYGPSNRELLREQIYGCATPTRSCTAAASAAASASAVNSAASTIAATINDFASVQSMMTQQQQHQQLQHQQLQHQQPPQQQQQSSPHPGSNHSQSSTSGVGGSQTGSGSGGSPRGSPRLQHRSLLMQQQQPSGGSSGSTSNFAAAVASAAVGEKLAAAGPDSPISSPHGSPKHGANKSDHNNCSPQHQPCSSSPRSSTHNSPTFKPRFPKTSSSTSTSLHPSTSSPDNAANDPVIQQQKQLQQQLSPSILQHSTHPLYHQQPQQHQQQQQHSPVSARLSSSSSSGKQQLPKKLSQTELYKNTFPKKQIASHPDLKSCSKGSSTASAAAAAAAAGVERSGSREPIYTEIRDHLYSDIKEIRAKESILI